MEIAWLLGPENIAALRRYRPKRNRYHTPFQLRQINRRALGTPHPDVQEAADDLTALGIELSVSPSRLAWEVNEYIAEQDDLRFSYHTQIIHLEGAGVEIYTSDWTREQRAITSQLSVLLGQRLAPARDCDDIETFVSAISGQIQGRELVVVAMRAWTTGFVSSRFRATVSPHSQTGPLSLSVAMSAQPRARPTQASDLPNHLRLEDLVSAARLTVFDGECVDDPESYRDVVQDILALSGGVLQADDIDCDEDDEERRHLQITARGQVFQAD